MLAVPAILQKTFPTGESYTVFKDDAQLGLHYVLPGFPTVRRDPNDNPVFQLIKYKLSDESREEDPDLPRGGGYMSFDVELMVPDAHREEIKKDLEQIVKAEWERLKTLPNDRLRTLTIGASFNDQIGGHWKKSGLEGTPRADPNTGGSTTLTMPGSGFIPPAQDAPPPPVVFGEPMWVSGKVTMNAPQAPGLVSGKLGERPASLLGNNVAAFNIDLTPDGAAFMEQTLRGTDGAGATDMTPIQVEYQLTMRAKLPPATMYVKFNTASIFHSVQELFHEHENCTDDYFTSESLMTTALQAGLVTIKIDSGGIQDPEVMQNMQQQATSMVQTLLANRFAEKDREKPKEWGDDDTAGSSSEIYRLKRETEVDMTDFEQNMEIRSTIDWTVAPQGSLQAFFSKTQDMTPFIRVVDANDPFFMTLQLKARAFAKWDEDDVAFVELEVKYDHGNELKTQTFTFTPKDVDPMKWDPSLIDGKRDYQYRWRVGFEGREAQPFSKWEKSTTRNLNISVATPGKLQVEVTAVGMDYDNICDAALVHLRYEDSSKQIPMASHSVLLSKDRASGTWSRMLYAPWDKPLEYRTEYLLKNGTVLDTGWKKTDGPSENLVIPRPEVDVLDLVLVPAGRWADVIQAVMSLRYADGAYQRDAQFNFKTPDEFKKWAVLLQNPRQRKFEYRVLATFKNGDTQETGWQSRESDGAVPVMVEGPPRLEVRISGAVLDYKSTPLAKIDLEYVDPDGTGDLQSYALQKPEDLHTWSVPIRKNGPRTYRRKISYFPSDGAAVERDWAVEETELIVVPRYTIPHTGAEFSPNLQDFNLTTAVEVNLAYDDPQRNVHERNTLVFTKNERQSWFLPVPDDAPRGYEMTITWYYADGSEKSSTPVKLEKPAVILPRAPKPGATPPVQP